MFDLNRTAEQIIYDHTVKDIYNTFVNNVEEEEQIETKSAFPSFPMNRLVYSIPYNEEIKDLAKKYHDYKGDIGKPMGYASNLGFQKYIDVTKMGNFDMSFDESMILIRKIRESLGSQFYGALISNNKMHDINPLHSLVLHQFMILDEKQKNKHGLKNYSVIIYTYKDQKLQRKYPDHFKKEKKYKTDILNLMTGSIKDIKMKTIITDKKLINKNNKFYVEYDEKIVDENGHELRDKSGEYKRNYIVPGQILNLAGISYPYYGAIHIKGGRAWNISPMWATNIGSPSEDGQVKGSTICTKVGDSRTARGCMTLNHSNTTSQRNPYTMIHGSLGYAQEMIDFSLEMYFDDYEKPKEPEIPKMDFKTFQEKGFGDRKAYLMYLRERIEGKINE